MSEHGVSEQQVGELRHTPAEAWQYDALHRHMQTLPPSTRQKFESAVVLFSLSRGLPVVVTDEGTLVTPLSVWRQMVTRYQYDHSDQVTEEHLMDLLGSAAVRSTALQKTGPIQDWATEIIQIQNTIRKPPQQ